MAGKIGRFGVVERCVGRGFLALIDGRAAAKAFDIHFEDDGVVNEPVDRRDARLEQ